MKNLKNIGILSILFSVFLFTSCENEPGEDDYVFEQLASITNYDTSASFASYKTFAIADSITYIDTDGQGNKIVTKEKIAGNAQLQAIANQVAKNMKDLKFQYTQVDPHTGNPDLGINLVAAKTTSIVVTNPWWWWDYPCWWDWWDCGWYPPYPYYPYPYVVGTYDVGTLSINIADLTVRKTSGQLDPLKQTVVPIVWVGTIRSLLLGTNNQTDVDNAINDCFNQTKAFQK